ncbi:beta-1,6-N-acetylglucosaminyltransferase [Scytonema sp. NUACC21]
MKVLYFIQSHTNPEQITRLVQIIKKSSPQSYILLSHNFNCSPLDVEQFRSFSNIEIVDCDRSRGDFSILKGYLDAIDWLFHKQFEFDWLVNISGQDYPTQPLPKIEKFLAETQYDCFLEYYNMSSVKNPLSSQESRERYLYKYWRSDKLLSRWQRAVIKIPRTIINNSQSFIRINSSYGLSLGVLHLPSPFNEKFQCYTGGYYHTISYKCVQYIYDFCRKNPDLVDYYKRTCLPEESFLQTILLNSQLFNICNNSKRYVNWSHSRLGHPNILDTEDYSRLIGGDFHFARKFDIQRDRQILDLLDVWILEN